MLEDSMYDFSDNNEISETLGGTLASKGRLKNNIPIFNRKQNENLKAIEDEKRSIEELLNKENNLSNSQEITLQKTLKIFEEAKKFGEVNLKNLDEYVKLWNKLQKSMEQSQKIREDNENKFYRMLQTTLDKEISSEKNAEKRNELLEQAERLEKQRKRSIDEMADSNNEVNRSLEDTSTLLKQIGKDSNNVKNSTQNLINSLRNVKSTIRDLDVMNVLGNIQNEIEGGANSWRGVKNQVAPQLGIASNKDWQDFKRDLISSTTQMNLNIGKALYSADDIKNYVSNLSQYGIYSVDLAEQNLQALIEGNKILGMSVETQNSLLKLQRRSGNDQLLNEVNDTVATLLNMQIGISKEQLNEMLNKGLDASNILTYMGYNNAPAELEKAQAYLTQAYSPEMATYLTEAITDLLQNGASSEYMKYGGANAMRMIQNGDLIGAMQSLKDNIDRNGIVAAGKSSPYGYNAIGMNNTVMGIAGGQRREGSMSLGEFYNSYEANKTNASSFASNITVGIGEQLKNISSLIAGYFGTEGLLGLQTVYYGLAIVEAGLSIKKLRKELSNLGVTSVVGKVWGKIKDVKFDAMTQGLLDMSANVASILAVALIVKDGLKAVSNKEEYGTDNSVLAFIKGAVAGGTEGGAENALGNALTKGIAGAIVGFKFGGIKGLVIGLIAGALIGGITGYIGGKDFLGFLNSKDSKGDAIGSPSSSFNAMGDVGSTYNGNYPWRKTSPFGYRNDPLTGKPKSFHSGVDLATAGGTPIGANVGGIVHSVGVDSYGANYVQIRDDNGFIHQYWHLQQPSTLIPGEEVYAGQLVGLVGTTGRSTGNHLHYGIKNPNGKAIDPEPYITSSLFNVSERNEQEVAKINDVKEEKRRLISANTLNWESDAAYYGMGDVVESVNGGFGNLISKLDQLSARQDQTEEMLQMITISGGNSMYRI